MGDRRVSDRGRVARIAGEPPMPGGLAELAELLGGESDRSRRFLGGLIAGALVGAAAGRDGRSCGGVVAEVAR